MLRPTRLAVIFLFLLQHLLVAELFQHFQSRVALTDTIRHLLLLTINFFGGSDDFLFFLFWHNNDTTAVGDDQIAWMALYTSELNFLIERILDHSPACRHRHRATCIQGKFKLA